MSEMTVDQFLKNLETLSRTLTNREVNLALGRKIREIIYRRVKSGYGVTNENTDPENTERTQLSPLSKSYIDYRRGLVIFRTSPSGHVYPIYNSQRTIIRRGKTTKGRGKSKAGAQSKISYGLQNRITAPKLGEFGRPAKSNLTLTGQMLNAIMIYADDGNIELYISPSSRLTPEGKLDKLNNEQLAKIVSKSRPWFALTSGELRIVVRELEIILQKRINELFG